MSRPDMPLLLGNRTGCIRQSMLRLRSTLSNRMDGWPLTQNA